MRLLTVRGPKSKNVANSLRSRLQKYLASLRQLRDLCGRRQPDTALPAKKMNLGGYP
jgi:hypothetical protein